MARPYLSKAKIKKAIPGTGGVISAVLVRTGYKNWQSVKTFILADPELSAMLQTEEELVDDAAESVLMKHLKEGDEQTAKWWLARRRRQRYGDSMDLTTKGESIQIVKVGIDIDKL